MKDIDAQLRSARANEPRRTLSADFTTRIVAELAEHPRPRRWMWRKKEALPMKKTNVALAGFLAVVIIVALGGATYAAIHRFSLHDLLNRAPVNNGHGVSPEDMQKIYSRYVDAKRRGDSAALTQFENSVTSELATKLNQTKGYDPVLCSQSIPTSVTFTHVNSTGAMTAVSHYAHSSVDVQLSYDSAAGLFVDITCPTSSTASVAQKMQGYYKQYITDWNNVGQQSARTNFFKHTTTSLKQQIQQVQGADMILCAQNIPGMVRFENVTNDSMTAVLSFENADQRVGLTFDPNTAKFTSITCPVPAQ